VVIFALLTYIGTKKVQEKIKVTLSLTLLLTLTLNPQSTKLQSEINRISYYTEVNTALHPSGVAKSSTSFGWGKGGKVTSAGWQVKLCDLIWHVISRKRCVISITNCYIRFILRFTIQLLSRCMKRN